MATGTWLRNLLGSSALNYLMLLAAIPAAIKFYDDLLMWNDQLEASKRRDYGTDKTEVFDFIIIGGGSAGAVVANRLSEDQSNKILVLEAGGDPNYISEIPLVADSLSRSAMAFTYTTVPQPNCCRANRDQVVRFPRGKGLGGSSNINGMMYIRGNPKDFDRWAEHSQDPAWAWTNVLQYFKKSEDYHGNYELGSLHSRGGPLYVGKLDHEPPVKSYFYDAVAEKGYKVGDINAVRGPVFSLSETNIKNGKRHTSFPAFFQSILGRKNLSIYRYSRAIKIHLDKNKRATGVTYIRHGKTYFVEARKEIIVSAGVIDSPRLLLLSGIGPKEHLQSVRIKPEVDLPVGKNYHDHFMTRMTILLNDTMSIINERDITVKAMFDYVQAQKGPISSTHSRIGIGYIASSSLEDRTWPDLYTIIAGQGVGSGFGTSDPYYGPHIGKDACQVFMALMRPNGPRGELKLASDNPDDDPVIDPKIFNDPSDPRRMAEGLMFMANLFETTASFRKLNAHVIPTPFPGCEGVPFKSLDYWDCYVRQFTLAGFHPVGTCKMGHDSDPTSVVDSKLRVLKTKGLRVIDASIMPIIMTGNPYASTVMIGELGSDFIKEEWSKRVNSNRQPIPTPVQSRPVPGKGPVWSSNWQQPGRPGRPPGSSSGAKLFPGAEVPSQSNNYYRPQQQWYGNRG